MNSKAQLDSTLLRIGLYGLVGGILGFVVGFYGPIYFLPDSPQGPLIGIFFTGPYGAIAGAIVGGLRSLWIYVKHGSIKNT